MTNSLTEAKLIDIITRIGNFDRAQAAGLNCLIFLAVREETTVTYQYEEIGFDDIPKEIVRLCDRLDDDDLLDLAGRITLALIMEKNAAALSEENA
ncbi:hypothetical protein [Nostoc sp.]|uniref:hypothetical protein n=1 Tax=Nostoc sp. TaxID=1180 RepID=UPI002FF83F1A